MQCLFLSRQLVGSVILHSATFGLDQKRCPGTDGFGEAARVKLVDAGNLSLVTLLKSAASNWW